MKKNFLKVASLLIAAMLLVVSCSQEVAPKTENNGLVEARLNVAYGRDLTVSGDTKQDSVTLQYAMYPQWNIGDVSEQIYGKSEGTIDNPSYENLVNGNLGYVTPGLWKVLVVAYGHDNGEGASENTKIIFSGDADVYFNETTKSATIFLSPVESGENTITFNFKMQALSGTMNGDTPDYVLEYKLCKNVDSFTTGSGTLIPCTSVDDNVCTFKATKNEVPSGFYRVNVSIYRKPKAADGSYVQENGKDKMILVGGTTKGFLVSGGANVTIGGNIEPSDYEKVSVDAIYVKVNTSFKDVTNGKFNGTITYAGSDTNATVTMSIDDSTFKTVEDNTEKGYTYTVTDFWTSVSDGEVSTGEQVTGTRNKKFTFTSPGYKNISCTTVYSITGKTTNDTDASVETSTYYFANTVSAQVYIDPVSFSAAPANSQTSGQ